ncbi:DUF2118 domain-containing protein [Desulfurococcus mucosus]|uniref:DUF2118 domain-containing protein n=1 Tax=Desulfurococcus mucosus (strain ATCC 35584 / DSM 2162 / JCM 9187 / O7/1) TaxID=765177 RepID=E8R7H5_DESM0|nr:DUF2118 domain-containing protein [Desulfurococcus mucosus]ADV65640.1 hypothetical protein Desmu_1346 [Desulfurococcus mucosus DSM 2162]
MSEYIFPEIFVEDVESNRVICVKDSKFILLENTATREECSKHYGSIPYEEVLNYVDLEKPALKRSIIILDKKRNGVALLFPGETPLCLQEVRGRAVFYVGNPERVRKGDLIAYVTTRKNEVRNEYSLCEGFLLAVIDLTWEKPERIVVVASSEQPREIALG